MTERGLPEAAYKLLDAWVAHWGWTHTGPMADAARAYRAARADPEHADDETIHVTTPDEAVDFVFRHLAKALGDPDWHPCDGTEMWESDVSGSVYEILRAARVLHPETNEVARHPEPPPPAEPAAVPGHVARLREWADWQHSDDETTLLRADIRAILADMDAAREALRAIADVPPGNSVVYYNGILGSFQGTARAALARMEREPCS